ncbi:MAG: hypothetical protein JXA24_03935 [Proteobacteria bacterium]|nr:hypothetical protein [Pseudomonadota bacterium]
MAIDAVVTQLNSSALGKAITNSEGMSKVAGQGSSFNDILSQKMDGGMEFADAMGVLDNDITPTNHMQSLEGGEVAFTPEIDVTQVGSPEASGKVLDMLGEVNKGQMQMDSLVNHILYSGKKFSNQELLVIQAHVFHFAQMTELTVKVAEQGVSSIKSVLNTQVQ